MPSGFPLIYAVGEGGDIWIRPAATDTNSAIAGCLALTSTNDVSVNLSPGRSVMPGVAATAGSLTAQVLTDGTKWQLTTMPAAGFWNGIAFGNGVFVAIDYGSSIAATSPNGKVWTQQTLPSVANWTSVVFANGQFVAVGTNVCATSPDGIVWTARTISAGTWIDVTYGNGVFVALVGWSATTVAATSTDGMTWTLRSLPSSQTWQSIAFGAGMFIAVAFNNVIATSSDGINWSAASIPESPGFVIRYCNGLFVVGTWASHRLRHRQMVPSGQRGHCQKRATGDAIAGSNGHLSQAMQQRIM